MNRNYKLISLEGNISAGKSTILEILKKINVNKKNIIFLKEPVDEWEKIKDRDGKTMLMKFYEATEKYAFSFQMMAYISRLKLLKDIIKSIQNTNEFYYIITERSLFTDKLVFAKMLFDQGKIEDVNYQIYLTLFDTFTEDIANIQYIYIKTDPIVCYERIKKS